MPTFEIEYTHTQTHQRTHTNSKSHLQTLAYFPKVDMPIRLKRSTCVLLTYGLQKRYCNTGLSVSFILDILC